MTATIVRPIAGRDELDLFNQFPYVLNQELEADLEAGRRRPEWLWIALQGNRVVARLAWWARGPADTPQVLDLFDIADQSTVDINAVELGAHLLRTAFAATLTDGVAPPGYLRFLPPGWREEEAERRQVEDRMAALEETGARLLVERLRVQWTAGGPVPTPNGRLTFAPADRAELIAAMIRVLDATLDAHSRRDLTRHSPEQVAAAQYDGEFCTYDCPRDWWRIGRRSDGEPVGFVVPARNSYHAIIAYIGVLPEHRGRGYIDDLLAEGTRILATTGVPRIRASTDVDNRPMARAFARAGYETFERQINMTWDSLYPGSAGPVQGDLLPVQPPQLGRVLAPLVDRGLGPVSKVDIELLADHAVVRAVDAHDRLVR